MFKHEYKIQTYVRQYQRWPSFSVIVDGKVAEVETFAFGTGQELLGRLILDIHYVEHGGRKAHACCTPRAVEQALGYRQDSFAN